MSRCLDEGVLQSYFDSELSADLMERVTSHLLACATCATLARELESENSLLADALAPEFDFVVPTERLRQRIDAALTGVPVVGAVDKATLAPRWRGWLSSMREWFTVSPQRAYSYAGMVVVLAFATVAASLYWLGDGRTGTIPAPSVAGPASVNVASPIGLPGPTQGPVAVTPVNANGDDRATVHPLGRWRHRVGVRPAAAAEQSAKVRLLPGERSYLRTIASLDTSINSEERPMRPALQAEYERNLALVDRAIAATRNAAKNNPNDPDAAEFMFAAYQSKVDLLNTVADARLHNRQR
jgi:anti-sigma factor RsiW